MINLMKYLVTTKKATTIAFTVFIASCSGEHIDQGNIVNNNDISQSSIFFDSVETQSTKTQPLSTISISPSTHSNDKKATIRYVDTESGENVIQQAYRKNAESTFNVLIPPIGIDRDATVDVYIESDGINQYLGILEIAPLPKLPQIYNKGDYSLHAMNSILNELRSAISVFKNINLSNGNSINREAELGWVKDLEAFSERNQLIINQHTDAVIFNNPIIDSNTNQVVITSANYELTDRMYLALSQRLATNGLLFDDHELGTGETTGSEIAQSFSLFSQAIEDFISTTDGLLTIASLSVSHSNQNVDEILSNSLDLFRATLMPSLVTNTIGYNSDLTSLPNDLDKQKFNSHISIIKQTDMVTSNMYILNTAHEALYNLNVQMNLLPNNTQ